MSAVVILACLLSCQQLHVEPRQVSVGGEVAVSVQRGEQPAAGVEVTVQLPDGSRRVAGHSGTDGTLRFVPEVTGSHAFLADVDAVRCLTPFVVTPVRRTWWLALGSVPLGLALLWLQVRRLRRARGA